MGGLPREASTFSVTLYPWAAAPIRHSLHQRTPLELDALRLPPTSKLSLFTRTNAWPPLHACTSDAGAG